jgi:3-hydroxyisobutyrate dehydrogenase-like beta-hydroxyacid dehydrogenase
MTLDLTRIGQIGLGYMGASLAKRLRDLGKTAIGHDIDAERMAAAAEAGVTCLDSAAAVTREVDVVVVCVTSTDCVEQAVFGPGGVAEAGAAGKVLIDISTTVAEATRDMAARLEEQTGMVWIDAPVSGGPPAAGSGALTVMAGGDAAVFDSLSPLWDDLTAKATLMGPIGAGQVTKMINQVLCLTLYPILAEALKLGENAGVEVARIPEALGAGYAGSNLLQAMFPRMVARQYAARRLRAPVAQGLGYGLRPGQGDQDADADDRPGAQGMASPLVRLPDSGLVSVPRRFPDRDQKGTGCGGPTRTANALAVPATVGGKRGVPFTPLG